MGWFPMIVISTFNPDSKRTTEDEELLTTLLAALIHYRRSIEHKKRTSETMSNRVYNEAQLAQTDVLIGSTFPLLGLSLTEVLELTTKKEE